MTSILILSAAASYAQTIYDGLMYSERNYEGTARSVAMGNAFTALGGDMGSIGINPAGSAVAKYSQIALTPALSISSCATPGYVNTSTRMMMPNYGMVLNFNTSRTSGLKGVTFGFVVNHVNSFNEEVFASDVNDKTTFMGAMASEATDMNLSGANLNMKDAYQFDPYRYVVGYQSGMISTFDGRDNEFAGASELIFDDNGNLYMELGGPLDQTYGRRVKGKKTDYLINLGFNISDFLYIGANLGITSMNYSYSDYFKEEAVDPSDFEIDLDNGQKMYFSRMKYAHNFNAETSGVYGKFGFILTPGAGLRIGAAIQTPTATTVNEEWWMDGNTEFTDSRYNGSAGSPYDGDKYAFREPWRANFGLAFTFGEFGALSADYEYCDYTSMKFKRDSFDDDREYFIDMNDLIKNTFRASHMFRAGLEIKPVDRLAIRAGYGLTTSPDREEHPEALDGEDAAKGLGWIAGRSVSPTQNLAFGLGYISRKSFFADLTCRYTFKTEEYFLPYDPYIEGVAVPEYTITKDAWKVLLTFGWRF